MWCLSCHGVSEHTEYCPEKLQEDLGFDFQPDQLALPWSPSPNSWLFDGLDTLQDIGPDIDLSLFEDNGLPDELMDWAVSSGEATGGLYPATQSCAVAAGSSSQVCQDGGNLPLVRLSPVRPSLLAEETSLDEDIGHTLAIDGADSAAQGTDMEPQVDPFPVIIPGWNVGNYEEIDCEGGPSAWPTANEIADQLIQEAVGPELGPSIDGCSVASSASTGTPSVRDMGTMAALPILPQQAQEIPSEGSDYAPVVSPISEGAGSDTSTSNSDKLLGPSRIQQHWSRLQARPRRMSPSRVAMVRPRPRQASLLRRKQNSPQLWQIFTSSPILQTHSILSRIIAANGDTMVEELNSRFNMTRTVSTQTYTPVYADVQTGMTDDDRPRSIIVIRVAGIVGAMQRNEAAHTSVIETPHLGRETASSAGSSAETVETSPATAPQGDSCMESDSTGTPLQDE
jgi:hypothetical protein